MSGSFLSSSVASPVITLHPLSLPEVIPPMGFDMRVGGTVIYSTEYTNVLLCDIEVLFHNSTLWRAKTLCLTENAVYTILFQYVSPNPNAAPK